MNKKADHKGCKFWFKLFVVCAVLLFLLCLFWLPTIVGNIYGANMTAVGSRGRDILVAIMGANAEREALGLPPIWPSDAPPFTNHITGKVECFDFNNSTDYFYYIFDGENYGTKKHNPMVAGFDFSKLAGAGVRTHDGTGPLKPENNMWTIAKNVTDETDDIVPFLITRNVEVDYLLSKIDGEPSTNRIALGESWDTPFSNNGAIFIRKGGGMFKVRAKYAIPRIIYNRQSFDANANSKYPLKYLTPTKEVIPVGKTD